MKKKTITINSTRKYELAIVEPGSQSILCYVEMLKAIAVPDPDNDTEVNCALNDILDKVLDLRIGQAMYFQPNRDNKEAKGIIMRIA